MPTTPIATPSTAGIAVLDLSHALEEIVGSEVMAAGLGRLPKAAQSELAGLTALSWVDNDVVSALVDAVAMAASREPEDLLDQAVRRAAERTFKTVWRMFLRIVTDEALIKRTPMMYSRSRNSGELSARIVTPGHAELTLSAWPSISDRQARGIGVSIQTVVSLTGRKEAQIRFTRTPDGVVYDLRWRA